MTNNLSNKEESIKKACLEFAEGIEIKRLIEKYNVSYSSIYKGMKKYEIPYKKKENRKHFFNQRYFQSIDCERKAYWLGLIMADGCIIKTVKESNKYNRVKLSLKLEDKYLLELFANDLNFTGEIFIHDGKGYSENQNAVIYLNSQLMCEDLILLGCLPNKTGSSSLPLIKEEFLPHFIRGYFDGDGCISVYNQTNKYKDKIYNNLKGEFSITSDEKILKEIQKVLIKNCNISESKLKRYERTEKAVSLRYGGKNQIKKIFDFLYKDTSLFLKRKYNNFSLLFS